MIGRVAVVTGAASGIGLGVARRLAADGHAVALLDNQGDAAAAAHRAAAALEALARDKGIAVVISDMRMPGMDGAAFLSQARQLVPNAMRILLTGQVDLDSAIAAVNEGQLFRFLTKPCPPSALLMAVDAAAVQHRLVMSERVLLEQTLHGSITALTDVDAIAVTVRLPPAASAGLL